MNARYAHVQQLAAAHPVTDLCALLAVRRGGYYAWRGRGPRPRQQEDARLAPIVAAAFSATRRTYGRGRLTHELKALGHPYGERRVRRLLRAQGRQARPRRRFRPQTTESRHPDPIAPNRLAEQPAPTRPNQVWATDFTYLPTTTGWLFLAVVLDHYSRRVVGWAFKRHAQPRPRPGRPAPGRDAPSAICRVLAPQRPGQPIRQRRLPRGAGRARTGRQHEPAQATCMTTRPGRASIAPSRPNGWPSTR